jgi:outer membrane biogenesis lipoprotein LolB
VLIQGVNGIGRRVAQAARLALLPLTTALLVAACTVPTRAPDTADLTGLSPDELANLFLQNEQSRGAVKFAFSGVITVTTGSQHRFRGVAGYRPCHALRMQLVGPLGFTLLDYLNVDGRATVVVDKITPDGDDEARAGLRDLMEIFTLALVDRCNSPEAFGVQPNDSAFVSFVVGTPPGRLHEFVLDRARGAAILQTFSGGALPEMTVEFGDYDLDQGHWMPAAIAVRTPDLPVSIDLSVTRWQAGADLPAGFFAD